MIELPNGISREDIYQWLGDGVFYARSGEQWRLARLVDTDGLYIQYLDEQSSHRCRASDIRIHWPRCGAINLETHALYVQRQQRRQWRRTYNARCVQVHTLGKWGLLGRGDAASMAVDTTGHVFMGALFDPLYPQDLSEAMELLEQRHSLALTPHLTMVQTSSPGYIVYYHTDRVGHYSGGEFRPACDALVERRVNKMIGVLDD